MKEKTKPPSRMAQDTEGADAVAKAIRARALADTKKTQADAVEAEAQRLRHTHEVTDAEAKRLAEQP